MIDWEKLLAQLVAVRAAPLPFLVAVLAVSVLIYFVNDKHYSGLIANKDSEIALYEGQRDDYKDKLSGASPDQAKKEIDDLQTKISALAKHIDPRPLSAEQERIFVQAATVSEGKPVVHVASDVACTDCAIYGGELARIFVSAGWDANTGIVMGPPLRPASGLALSLSNTKNPTPAELKLLNALRTANIPFDLLGETGTLYPQLLITVPAPH
jgi:hypothetical protein